MPVKQKSQCRQVARAMALVLGTATFVDVFAADPEEAKANEPVIHAGPVGITFGGFVELATIYRDRNETADISSNFNTGIPFPQSPQYHVSEFRQSARQSRISIQTQWPPDGDTAVEAYFEMDFQSSAPTANSVESNSYNPRLRQAYGTYRRKDRGFYFLAGQSFSLLTLNRKGMTPHLEQIPVTIDGQYVPGFNWTRNPQARFVKEFEGGFAVGVSLESPQASIFNGPNPAIPTPIFNNPGGQLLAPTVNYSLDILPDVIAKVTWDPAFGHYEFYGLGRAYRDRVNQQNNTILSGAVGGGMILPVVKQLDVQLTFLVGRGIGRYGSAQLPDVTIRPNGELATVAGYQGLLGLLYRPTPAWTVYTYAGLEHAQDRAFTAVVNGATLGYGYGSPLYNNSGCLTEGTPLATCAGNTNDVGQVTAGAWWKYYQGVMGNLQFGVQGSYTRRKAFDGVGGDPHTNISMGMLSFRFYPYQK